MKPFGPSGVRGFGELRLVETLDDRQHRRVDKTDIGIGVAITDLSDSPIVGRTEILDRVRSVLDIADEGDQRARVKPLVDPVVDLHQHRGRNHERLIR
jgi:hypothetical protein